MYYAIAAAAGGLVVFVLQYIFQKDVAASAENVEKFAAKQVGSVAKVAGQAQKDLQAPGK